VDLRIHPCPLHESNSLLHCERGCSFPIVGRIPRFVSERHYATSFGLQWNIFRRSQLDSYTGTTISRDRLTRLLGGTLDIVRGQQVLEAGCGAGRFTEILLQAGAHVLACDLSNAVDANYANIGEQPGYTVCEADIAAFPVLLESFDIVVCIGVAQHTPDPEATKATLCSHVKLGGLLVLDHYTYGYARTSSRRLLRSLLLRVSAPAAMQFCTTLGGMSLPIHRWLWQHWRFTRERFLRLSLVVDYQDLYGQLSPEILRDWALLDTHDTLTDVYNHLRSTEEISQTLQECGMTRIETVYVGNGVEARA
jgi:SAM-dependent methyltransferase